MPRPVKNRKVCCLPQNNEFRPSCCHSSDDNKIYMTVDEYEAIRLIDYKGFTQEECSQYMKIARTTVQDIYTKARKKISIAIVEAKVLIIEGGNYHLCDGKESECFCGGCQRHRQ